MKYIISAIVLILILFSFMSKEVHIKPLHPNDSILAFGDSLTYGYNAKPEESYPSTLTRLSGYTVINAGIPAETSYDGLRRLPALLENKQIKLMILFFGGNDILQRLPTAQLKANLKTMIQMAKEKEIDVLLISIPNIGLFGLSPLDLYEEVAEEENIPLLSGMMAEILANPSLKSDQIHPNAQGYEHMGEAVYEKLKAQGWL